MDDDDDDTITVLYCIVVAWLGEAKRSEARLLLLLLI